MPETMKLEPCPRCGSPAFVTINFGVMCEVDRCLHLPPRANREEAIEAWNRRPAQQSEPVAVVREIETVTGDYLTDPGEPFYRIELGGYCADFGYRKAAENFAAQINALVANPPDPLADHELTPTTVDDREPSDDVVETGKFTTNETALMASSAIMRMALMRHDEAIRTAIGFEGIEQAADAQDQIMAELPSFLQLCELVTNYAVDQRAALSALQVKRDEKVIAWLRKQHDGRLASRSQTSAGGPDYDLGRATAYAHAADAIERGQHMGGGE